MKEDDSLTLEEKEEPCLVRRPRAYKLGRRAAAMEETRARIVAAAREVILSASAIDDFSMEAVARQAGVSRMTVYHRFESKRGLLEALFDDMGARGRLGERLPLVFSSSDAREALRLYVETFCEFWESDRALNHRLGAFVTLDEEFAAAIAGRASRRRGVAGQMIRILHAPDEPSPADFEQQTRTLLALTSFHFYDALAGTSQDPHEVAPIISGLVLSALGLEEK